MLPLLFTWYCSALVQVLDVHILSLVFGPLSLVPCPCSTVLGPRSSVLGPWSLVHGPQSMLQSPRSTVHDPLSTSSSKCLLSLPTYHLSKALFYDPPFSLGHLDMVFFWCGCVCHPLVRNEGPLTVFNSPVSHPLSVLSGLVWASFAHILPWAWVANVLILVLRQVLNNPPHMVWLVLL